MDDALESALRSFTASVVRLSRGDERTWLAAWTEIYCQPVFRRTGRNRSFRWETFLHGARSIEGVHAIEAYLEKLPDELVVLRTSERGGAFRLEASTLFRPPTLMDVLIFSTSLEWTMAFTHEELYGPYYSEARWCVDSI
jgi:hypothetical protein